MTWEDELRQLDEQLRAGRIAADDYRIRREQLLAAAAGAQQQPPQDPDAKRKQEETTQVIRPVAPPVVPPGGANPTDADSTQVVSERTQVVPKVNNPAGPPAPPGPGRYPAAPGSPSPPGGIPRPGPPWGAADDASPPWAGADFPPLAPTPGWVKQGPEVFDRSSSTTRRTLAVVGIVVVAALIGVGIWWFGFGRNDNTSHASPPALPTPTTTSRPLIDQVPAPPGQPGPHNGLLDVSTAGSLGVLDAAQVQAAQTSGVRQLVYKSSTNNGFTYQVFVYTASSAGAAGQLADALNSQLRGTGLVPGAHGDLPPNATVLQYVRPNDTAHYSVIYTSGRRTVVVDVVQQPAGPNDQQILDQFEPLAMEVAAIFPGS